MNRIKNSRQVEKALNRAGAEIRVGRGSHRIAKLPNGDMVVYYECSEYPVGMAHKLTKVLAAAGLIGGLLLLFLR